MPAAPGRFPTTSWSLVLAAGAPATRRPALEALCAAYWSPVYAFIRRQGTGPEDAKDLTQSFFTRLIEKQTLSAAEAGRARFRSFLLACVQNFLHDEWDRARAQKRGGDATMLPFDFEVADRWLEREAAEAATPETIFERRWAATVLERSMESLQREFEAGGQAALFERLKPFLEADREEPQSALAARLGMSEGALKMAVLRLRRRYRKALERDIADTLVDPADLEGEIRHLLSVLQR